MKFLPFLFLIACGPAGAASLGDVKPFLESHCYDCHDAKTHKADLRLDSLSFDPANEDAAKIWTRVFDKVVAGEMPPKKSGQPTPAQRAAATKVLHDGLYAASLAHQQQRGRVVVRRLNATEYENTVRDLLGTRVNLKQLLPEDSAVAGFDTVSVGLDLSAKHFLMYQKAAERAVESVFPFSEPVAFREQRTGKEILNENFKDRFRSDLIRASVLRPDGDALIIYRPIHRFLQCVQTGRVPSPGRYRIQMKAAAVGPEGKAVPVGYYTGENLRDHPVFKELHDIQPGPAQVYEFVWELGQNQSFAVNPLAPEHRGEDKEGEALGLRLDWIKIEGPIDAFPPPAYNTLFEGMPLARPSVVVEPQKKKTGGGREAKQKVKQQEWEKANPLVPVSKNPKADAERLMRSFMHRAFRRPLSAESQQRYVDLVLSKLDAGYSFDEALTFGYKLILSSPDFLFLASPGAADAQGNLASTKLDDYSLGERLSYFLTASAPDAELLALAQQGVLSNPDVLRAQTERLLNSPKAARFTEAFTGQWLDLRELDATTPDPKLYGDFDTPLEWAMPRETMSFFDEVLRHDLPLTDFVQSDWTMLNARLAAQYGIAGVEGSGFRKVKLPPGSHRGGVMTQSSILKVTADGTRTSPVLRGKWVLERILGKPPQPPPPGVPALEPDIRGATTIRQQLDKHRNNASCASCHIHIDPPGFALETYDPIGNWRDFYRVTHEGKGSQKPQTGSSGPAVEKGGTTPEGRTFKDIDEYKAILLRDKDQIARNLAQKLIVYATGADIQFADREVVEQLVARVRQRNYGFRTLIHEVIQSRVFLNK